MGAADVAGAAVLCGSWAAAVAVVAVPEVVRAGRLVAEAVRIEVAERRVRRAARDAAARARAVDTAAMDLLERCGSLGLDAWATRVHGGYTRVSFTRPDGSADDVDVRWDAVDGRVMCWAGDYDVAVGSVVDELRRWDDWLAGRERTPSCRWCGTR